MYGLLLLFHNHCKLQLGHLEFGAACLYIVFGTHMKAPTSSIGFAYFGQTVASMGNIFEGCRLGEFVVGYAAC